MSTFVLPQNNLNSRRTRPVLLYAGVPVVVTVFLWATGSNDLSIPEILAGLILCWIPWASYQDWYRGSRRDLPLFGLIAAMYWGAYAVPLFWGSRVLGLVGGDHLLSEHAIAQSMYLVVIGVLALWVGMRIAANWRWVPSTRLDVPQRPWRWQYLRIVLIATVLMKVAVPITAWGESARQIVVNIESFVASIVFVILLRSWFRGEATEVDKVLVSGYFLVALVVGLSSGWLGTFVGLGIICVAAFVFEKRRFPVTAMLVILPVVLFLQPGKAKFREVYWKHGPAESYSESYTERIGFWIDASARAWGNAVSDPSGNGFRQLSGNTLVRVSLLEQTANVVETTPRRIPYQHARLYSYLLVTFVPRFLWPDKPLQNEANGWYQVAYHLTLPTNTVGMAVGTVTESYISFGWMGPLTVMLCLGVVLGVVRQIFMRNASGLLFSSIGVALLPGLLAVESQMAVYVAGMVQQVFFALLTLAPVIIVGRRDSPSQETSVSRARAMIR